MTLRLVRALLVALAWVAWWAYHAIRERIYPPPPPSDPDDD